MSTFVPDLWGKVFSISPLNGMLTVGLSYLAFTILRYNLAIFKLLRFVLSWVAIEFSQILFLHLLRWLYNFNFSLYWYDVSDLCLLSHPCLPEVSSWYMTLWMCRWIWFASILLRLFVSISSGILACGLLSLYYPYLPWYKDNAGPIKWVWKWSQWKMPWDNSWWVRRFKFFLL